MKNVQSVVMLLISMAAMLSCKPNPHYDPIHPHAPKTYQVNLQDSPMVRWGPIIKDQQSALDRFIHFYDKHVPVSKTFLKKVEWYARNEFRYQDFVAEVDAISRLSGHPFDKMLFLSFAYEYSTIGACTGILVRTHEGKILHGRNLDITGEEVYADLSVIVEYHRNGELLYTGDVIAGSPIALSVHKKGSFSLEVNIRHKRSFSDDLIEVLAKNAIPTVWLLNKVAEEESDFEGAMKRLETERLSAPVYFVVSGIKHNEGAVIERNNDDVHFTYRLSEKDWFLVQTNYDREKPDPQDDMRRWPVEERLAMRGNKNFTKQALFDEFMSTYPTLVRETILTVVMSSEESYHNTTVWYTHEEPQQQLQLTVQ